MYYTIYNNDERRRSLGTTYQPATLLTFILNHEEPIDGYIFYDYASKFFILRINQDIFTNIETISSKFLSSLPNIHLRGLSPVGQIRCFSTAARGARHFTGDESSPKILEILEPAEDETKDKPFELQLLETQMARIQQIFANHSSPDELNVIYPLYQSLKRNDLPLPDIHAYNIVLMSISQRSLDSDSSLESIESKLTTMLNIYEDILHNSIKPSYKTYDIILSELFDGSNDVMSGSMSNAYSRGYHMKKSTEFGQIGLELFNSISTIGKLEIPTLAPKIFKFLARNPEFLNKPIFEKLAPHIVMDNQSGEYYLTVLEVSKFFKQSEIFKSEDAYNFINSAYMKFRSSNAATKFDEYLIYSKMIEALMNNNCFKIASKFLDKILVDYKRSLDAEGHTSKANISAVLSAYIRGMINNDAHDLSKAFNLVKRFNGISYLPELENSIFNDLIIMLVSRFNYLELQKSNSTQDQLLSVENKQRTTYERIWYLYEYMAIRKDYQESSTMSFLDKNSSHCHCRDAVLSLCINLGDHSRVFQLIKEVLLKNHLIYDLTSFQKLLNYLNNGVIYNANGELFNQYYFGLLWSVIASQSIHYLDDSRHLNAFLSEFVNYLQLPAQGEGSEFIEYSIRLFMNSTMIEEAVNLFNLQTDNIYGLLVVSRVLMSYTHTNDMKLLHKILAFQSRLINQFEDTENHYIELGPDLMKYKSDLKTHIVLLVELVGVEKLTLSDDLANALQVVGIPLPQTTNTPLSLNLSYDLNLSHLFTVNYEKGQEKFIEMFKKGYTFSSSTWSIILNYNFINENLKYSKIHSEDLVKRLNSLGFDDNQKVMLFTSLLKCQNDDVTIKFLKFLIGDGRSLLKSDLKGELVYTLLKSVDCSRNIYLKKLILDNGTFLIFFTESIETGWVSMYLQLLDKNSKFSDLVAHVEYFKLDLKTSEIFRLYAASLLKLDSDSKFMEVFKKHAPRSLAESPLHVELLMEYYIKQKTESSISFVTEKLASYKSLSERTTVLFLFASAIQALTSRTEILVKDDTKAKSIDELSLRILNYSFNDMKLAALENKNLFANKAAKAVFVESLIKNLKRVSNFPSVSTKEVALKFEAIIKLFRYLRLKHISVKSLLSIIDVLSSNKMTESLNILATKLTHNGKCSEVLNFYFMETYLETREDKEMILQQLRAYFEESEDHIRAALLKDVVI